MVGNMLLVGVGNSISLWSPMLFSLLVINKKFGIQRWLIPIGLNILMNSMKMLFEDNKELVNENPVENFQDSKFLGAEFEFVGNSVKMSQEDEALDNCDDLEVGLDLNENSVISQELRKTEKPLEAKKPLMKDILKRQMFLEQSDNWFNTKAVAKM